MVKHEKSYSFSKIKDIASVALMVAVISVSSWITIPYTVPFTMQTFAVFLSLRLLGGKRGSLSVILYILTGAAGLPVFSGFRGGIGVLAGPTGGYITGFILASAVYLISEKQLDSRAKAYTAMFLGLFICYLTGTVQFMLTANTGMSGYGFFGALSVCVLPYIIPDIIKIILADIIAARVGKAIKL